MKKRKRGENEEDKQERGQGQDGGIDVLAWSDQARMVCEKAFVVCRGDYCAMARVLGDPGDGSGPRSCAQVARRAMLVRAWIYKIKRV